MSEVWIVIHQTFQDTNMGVAAPRSVHTSVPLPGMQAARLRFQLAFDANSPHPNFTGLN